MLTLLTQSTAPTDWVDWAQAIGFILILMLVAQYKRQQWRKREEQDEEAFQRSEPPQ